MTTYYVATLARYILVEAADEHVARELGQVELRQLYGHDDFSIRIVRSATDVEIEFTRWHEQKLAELN